MAVDEAGFITGQPERSVCDVLRQSGPLDRLEILEHALHEWNDLVGPLRRETHRLAEDRRRDAAGTDAVDPDASFTELHRHRVSQMDDRGLGGAIDVRPKARPETGDAGGADDRARALLLHHGCRVLDAEEDPAQEHADGRVETVDRNVLDLSADARVPGIVEDAVEPAKALAGLCDRRLHVRFAAHVRVEIPCASAELTGETPAAIVLDIGQHHRGAFFDEETHGGLTDAARSAGDECDLALETSHAALRPARAPSSSQRFRGGATGLRSRARPPGCACGTDAANAPRRS